MSAVIHAAELCGSGVYVTSAAYSDTGEGVLIYDNSYNMPPGDALPPSLNNDREKKD